MEKFKLLDIIGNKIFFDYSDDKNVLPAKAKKREICLSY